MAAFKKKNVLILKKKIVKTVKKKTVIKKVPLKKKNVLILKKKTVIKKAPLKKKKIVKVVKKSAQHFSLSRSHKNPIIEPTEHRLWESKATFNPTAIYHDGKVRIIYRAIGHNDVSVLGYAESVDGHHIIPESKELAYYDIKRQFAKKEEQKEITLPVNYSSGGGWSGGCEDPRLTMIDDRVYMIYTSFDGWGSVRMALTSIKLKDFLSKNFNWKEPVLISPPNQIHKNWVLFPEKINGKYAILHSISPKVMIDYFKSLDELDGDNFIYSVHGGSPMWEERDRLIRGVGPSPIKTKSGWLVLYHKMEKNETHRYKLWAMLLDLEDPTKILHNSVKPILEPDLWYENEGYKAGVIYSCGAIVKDGKLFVYYGGADTVSCVATADLNHFLKELTESKDVELKNKKRKI